MSENESQSSNKKSKKQRKRERKAREAAAMQSGVAQPNPSAVERRERTQAPEPSSVVVTQPPELVRGHVLQNGPNSLKPALMKDGHNELRTDSV